MASCIGPERIILNREFAMPEDGYIHLVPIGEFAGVLTTDKGEAKRVTQVLDRAALERMANAFKGEAMVDYEHFSHEKDKATTAAGWITGLTLREDGLYAAVRWSNSGKAAVQGGDYRYISPEFEGVEDAGKGRVRPTLLTGAGLTNRPNLKTLKPLSNKEFQSDGGDPASIQPTKGNDTMSKLINKALGLADDAAEQSTAEAVAALKNRASTAESERDALKNKIADLEKANTALLTAQVEADLEKHKDVIANREEVKAALLANRDGTLKLLAALKPTKAETKGGHMTNRHPAKQPEKADEQSADKQLEAEVQKYRISNKCSYGEAFDAVRRDPEKAHLFNRADE